MGFLYLFNCVALAIGPHCIIYRTSGLKEYDVYGKCTKVALIFCLVSLLKMFVSTLIPTALDTSTVAGSLVYDFVDSVIELVTIISLLKSFAGNSIQNVLASGLSWSFTGILLTSFLPLWIGTRQLEFSWEFFLISVNANFKMLVVLSLFVNLWITLKSLPKVNIFVVTPALLALMQNSAHILIHHKAQNDLTTELGSKCVFSIGLAISALLNYTAFIQQNSAVKSK